MTTFTPPEFNFDFGGGFSAYDYQQEAFNISIEHMRKSTEPAYVYASVSAGKSLLIAMIAKHFQNVNLAAKQQGFSANHRVLMLVRTGDLVKQNAEEAWGIDCKNSIWCSSLIPKAMRSNSPAYDCVMGSEKSVYNSLFNELEDFKPTVLLIDECHTLNYEDPESQQMKIIAELKRRNPNLRIWGCTGSPWRGREHIKGDFWKHELVKIDREYLTNRGFVMKTEFGFGTGDAHYESIDPSGFEVEVDGDCELTRTQLAEMEKKILSEGTKTQQIMLDVMKRMRNRNVALITCAGRKHCEEAAKYLPEGSYAIITEKTNTKDRIEIKRKCNEGELKYVLQVGVWTVGVSIPRIDTIVIMRMIGSVTMYEQLVGRGVRRLKQPDIDAGIVKNECLVLDYTDTSALMSELMSSDEMDRAEKQRAKDNQEEMMICPKCNAENSMRARRCSGIDDSGHRCDFFFSSKICADMYAQQTGMLIKKGCGVENDPSSRVCRGCGGYMKDPNEKLIGQAYSNDDLIPVTNFTFGLTKAGDKVLATYRLANGATARELFDIKGREKWKRATWTKFVRDHFENPVTVKALSNCFTPEKVLQFEGQIKAPIKITHRRNDRGFDVIARKVFEE